MLLLNPWIDLPRQLYQKQDSGVLGIDLFKKKWLDNSYFVTEVSKKVKGGGGGGGG